MDMTLHQILETIAIWGLPVLFAITLHEAAHGYVAKLHGDRTAEMLGRVTLNPIKHIDPIGTIVLPITMLIMTSFVFGYAKPVPVFYQNLRDQRWSVVAVALAGPAANVILALISVFLMHFAIYLPPEYASPALQILVASVQINVLLCMFNLFPLLPLDGGRAIATLLPTGSFKRAYESVEPYGMWILLALLVTGVMFTVLSPMVKWGTQLLVPLMPMG